MILEKQILPSESCVTKQTLFIRRAHFTYKGRISSYPSIHCSPQMSPLPSLTRLPHNKPFSPLWEPPPRFPQPWLVHSELRDCVQMCLEEGQAPLPWENMWSRRVYTGTLSSCLPHSMLGAVYPLPPPHRRQRSTILPLYQGVGHTGDPVDFSLLT